MMSEEYNEALDIVQCFQNIDASISEDVLDILELFAQDESLTITDITNHIVSTKIQRKYKNVYYLIEKLKSRGLIEQQKNVDKARRRHNQIYFKLTDQGIYLLFLKLRYHGILIDQLSVKKGNPPVSHIDNFLKYYGDNALFELFLYPYFEKQTIYAAHIDMLVKLFGYLHNCCKQVNISKGANVVQHLFYWNKVPGENNSQLLASLKEIFMLENIDSDNTIIKKSSDNSTITVTAAQVTVVIKLDEKTKKATATSEMAANNNTKKYDYTILYYGREIMACTLHGDKSQVLDSKRLLEAPIYELVRDIGIEYGISQEYINMLAQDTKFMSLVEQAHNEFRKGYHCLMRLRKNS
jgi:DNA-binding PadR family transcriptional regulator